MMNFLKKLTLCAVFVTPFSVFSEVKIVSQHPHGICDFLRFLDTDGKIFFPKDLEESYQNSLPKEVSWHKFNHSPGVSVEDALENRRFESSVRVYDSEFFEGLLPRQVAIKCNEKDIDLLLIYVDLKDIVLNSNLK